MIGRHDTDWGILRLSPVSHVWLFKNLSYFRNVRVPCCRSRWPAGPPVMHDLMKTIAWGRAAGRCEGRPFYRPYGALFFLGAVNPGFPPCSARRPPGATFFRAYGA